MLLHVRMFLRPVFKKICTQTSVLLGSDIIALSKGLMGKCDFGDIRYRFFGYFIMELNETSYKFVLLHMFLKRNYRANNRVVILRTVD